MKDNIYAHRGYHDINKKIPENSILAFKRAVRYGYGIELDVHLLNDGNIVVFHDNNLKRVCGVDKAIELCTYAELLNYNLLGTKEKIPLFKDVLSVINGSVPILIETKVIKFDGKLESILLKALKGYTGKVLVQSFNPFSVLWFKKHSPSIKRGLLIAGVMDKKTLSINKMTIKTFFIDLLLRSNFISYNIKFLPNKYISFKRFKKNIFGWTIRTKQEYAFAKKYCDYLICENMNNFK